MGSPAVQADSLPTELSESKVLLYFSRYYKIKNVYFLCLAFTYYLREKYYKHITVQCCVANCVSWVPRLTLLDLQTNCTYEPAPGMEPVPINGTQLQYSCLENPMDGGAW